MGRQTEREMSICDFSAADSVSRATEECGCALCQLVAAQCGKVLTLKARQTQMCKHRKTERDENKTKNRSETGHGRTQSQSS